MRKFLLLSAVAIVAVVIAAPVVADKGKTKEVPFKAAFAGEFGGFLPVIGDRCADTPEGKVAFAVASFEGSGKATHLGKTHAYATHCSYGVTVDGQVMLDGTYGQGELMLTAANNDVLLATYTDGESFPGQLPFVEFEDSVTFEDGGTGRFTFASGHATEVGSVSFPLFGGDGSFTLKIEGVIAYSKR